LGNRLDPSKQRLPLLLRAKVAGAERTLIMESAKLSYKVLVATAAVFFLCLLAACGPVLSIYPLYTDKDVVFDPGLLGTWIDPADKSSAPLVFERSENDSYKLATPLDENSNVDQIFQVHIVKLFRMFLDALQTKSRISGQEVDVGIAIPAHLLARFSLTGESLHIDLLEEEWIKKQLDARKISITHEEAGDDIVLTASRASGRSWFWPMSTTRKLSRQRRFGARSDPGDQRSS
jgi:hypothetical protein